MTTLTLRLPEDMAQGLKSVASAKGMSVNRFITDISLQALAGYDTEIRYKAMTASADTPAALAVLDKLDGKQTPA